MPIFNNILAGSSGQGDTGYDIDQSLRVDDGDSANLSRTPSSASNRKTWTWSGWVKRGNLATGSNQCFFSAGVDGSNFQNLAFNTSDALFFDHYESNVLKGGRTSTAVYRDTSAWYHIVVAYDTTQSTASDRIKIYVNGEVVSDFSSTTDPALNHDGIVNNTVEHRHFSIGYGPYWLFDGYLAEVNFIDGTALTPTSFGETNADTNQWVPIEYTGSYGTNGFYLDFSIGSGYTQFTSTGSNTWTCPAGVTSIDVLAVGGGGGGGRNSLQGGGGGAGGLVYAENYSVTPGVEYDITIGAGGAGTTGTATNGANGSDTVFNVNAEGGGATITAIGGGGGAGFHEGSNGGSGGGGQPGRNGGNATQGNSGGGTGYGNNGAAGYSGGGTDDHGGGGGGAGAAGTTAVTNKAGNGGIGRYYGYRFGDSVGDSGYFAGGGGGGTRQQASAIGIGGSGGGGNGQFNGEGNEDGQANTGGGGGGGSANDSGGNGGSGTVILVPSSASFIGSDSSGNGNNFTATNITATDKLLDSPANNFATLNPLASRTNGSSSITLSEGNLKISIGGTGDTDVPGTIPISSGKWYAEVYAVTMDVSNTGEVGITESGFLTNQTYVSSTPKCTYLYSGRKRLNGSSTSTYGSSWSSGDIVGIALNLDDNEITFYKNNSSQGAISITADEYVFTSARGSGTPVLVWNFGQDSSFAGNKTSGAAGSDFYYTPPTGFNALSTDNLSDPSVADPTAYFNTVLYTGNGSTQSITGVGFQPDFTWLKHRNNPIAYSHQLYDVVRGATNYLVSNTTAAENDGGSSCTSCLTSFDSDGFSLGSNAGINSNTINHVSWNWKAGGTASSNTDGTITSSVSANTTAGFSIVSWTGNGTNGATVGHGLSQTPELIITKNRDDVYSWQTVSTELTSKEYLMYLNTTDAEFTTSAFVGYTWNDSVITFPSTGYYGTFNVSGDKYIGYAFHSVDGYSKVGKYRGNSNADGPMFYCGFKPSWAMFKAMDSAQSWTVFDNKRNVYNLMDNSLFPDLSNAENDATSLSIDFVSNGIKIRSTHNYVNYSGSDYLVLAFAESPFKTSNAR